jgi:hypothetical protein
MSEQDRKPRVNPEPAADGAELGRMDDERTQTGANEEQRAGLQQRQAEQNRNQNDRYDPSAGAQHNQLRRNDKKGQMGG